VRVADDCWILAVSV